MQSGEGSGQVPRRAGRQEPHPNKTIEGLESPRSWAYLQVRHLYYPWPRISYARARALLEFIILAQRHSLSNRTANFMIGKGVVRNLQCVMVLQEQHCALNDAQRAHDMLRQTPTKGRP